MRRSLTFAIVLTICALPVRMSAQDPALAEQAFFDKHISEIIKIVPKRLANPALQTVFSATFYDVQVLIKDADGGETRNGTIVAHVGEKFISVGRPGSDTDLPDFQKMIKATFKMKTTDDANTFQQALDAAYPIIMDADKKVKTIRHTDNQWIFVRGQFFKDQLGYVLQTDPTGAIKSVKFMLKLP